MSILTCQEIVLQRNVSKKHPNESRATWHTADSQTREDCIILSPGHALIWLMDVKALADFKPGPCELGPLFTHTHTPTNKTEGP